MVIIMKKLLPIFLTLVVCFFSMIPIRSFAEEQAEATEQVTTVASNQDIIDFLNSIGGSQQDEEDEPVGEDEYIKTGTILDKILALPHALVKVVNTIYKWFIVLLCTTDPGAKEIIPSEVNQFEFGIDLNQITDPGTPLGKCAEVIKIFAYGLVLLFFGVNLIEQTVKYEVFNMKGIARLFGRLLLAKIIIDISATICILIIKIIGAITLDILFGFDFTRDILPNFEIKMQDSNIPIIGAIIDALIAICLAAALISLIGLYLIPLCILVIKLIIRTIELAILVTVAPAFFACLSSDVTKEYFKKFISVFLPVACQTLFMAIPLVICLNYMTTDQTVQMNGLSAIGKTLLNIIPHRIIMLAIFVIMIKPPKVLTNLIK